MPRRQARLPGDTGQRPALPRFARGVDHATAVPFYGETP